MRTIHKLTSLLLAAGLALCLNACGAAGEPETPPAVETAPAVTEPVQEPEEESWSPDLSFETLDSEGEIWTDAVFAEHELTLINYWAYWCGPCVSELPELQRLYEDYADRGLLVLGVSDEEYEADNRQVVEETGVSYPCLRYTEAFDAWMNTGYIPTTIFVDGSGKVVGSPLVGSRSYEDWAAFVEEYLP